MWIEGQCRQAYDTSVFCIFLKGADGEWETRGVWKSKSDRERKRERENRRVRGREMEEDKIWRPCCCGMWRCPDDVCYWDLATQHWPPGECVLPRVAGGRITPCRQHQRGCHVHWRIAKLIRLGAMGCWESSSPHSICKNTFYYYNSQFYYYYVYYYCSHAN